MTRLLIAGMAHPHVRYILEEIAHHPHVELVATSDPEQEARQRWTPSGVPTYADHRRALQRHRPEVVFACGIYGQRAETVIDALQAGAHVIADKPLCTTLEDLERIENAAAEAGRIVSVVFEKRWDPVTAAARQLVAQGVLGTPTLIAATGPHKLNAATRPPWFFTRSGYGHVLGDLPVHDIDLVLALTGVRSGQVLGHSPEPTQADQPHWPDAGAVMLCSDRLTATLEAHWMWPQASGMHGRYQMRITGTAGVAELDWGRHRLHVETHERPRWQPDLLPGKRPAYNALSALGEGRRPEVGTAESLAATRVALLAVQTTESGEPLPWHIDTPRAH